MANNEFVVQRTAVAPLLITSATSAFTQNSGVIIPAGAIITGIVIEAGNDARTVTNVSQTVVPKVGTAAIAATVNVKTLPAQTACSTTAVTAAEGFVVMTAGELNIVGGATGTSAVTGTGSWNYYVDYLYVV